MVEFTPNGEGAGGQAGVPGPGIGGHKESGSVVSRSTGESAQHGAVTGQPKEQANPMNLSVVARSRDVIHPDGQQRPVVKGSPGITVDALGMDAKAIGASDGKPGDSRREGIDPAVFKHEETDPAADAAGGGGDIPGKRPPLDGEAGGDGGEKTPLEKAIIREVERLDPELLTHSPETRRLVEIGASLGREVTEQFGTPGNPKIASGTYEEGVLMSYHNGGEDGHTSVGPDGAGVPRNVLLIAQKVNETAGWEVYDPLTRAIDFYAAQAHDARQLCGRTLLPEGQGEGRGDERLSAKEASERYLAAGGDKQIAKRIYKAVMATAFNPETYKQNVAYEAWHANPEDPEFTTAVLSEELVAASDLLNVTTHRGPLSAIESSVETLFLRSKHQLAQERLHALGIDLTSINSMEQMVQIISEDEVLRSAFTDVVAEKSKFFSEHIQFSDKAIRAVCGQGIDAMFPGRLENAAVLDEYAAALRKGEKDPLTIWREAKTPAGEGPESAGDIPGEQIELTPEQKRVLADSIYGRLQAYRGQAFLDKVGTGAVVYSDKNRKVYVHHAPTDDQFAIDILKAKGFSDSDIKSGVTTIYVHESTDLRSADLSKQPRISKTMVSGTGHVIGNELTELDIAALDTIADLSAIPYQIAESFGTYEMFESILGNPDMTGINYAELTDQRTNLYGGGKGLKDFVNAARLERDDSIVEFASVLEPLKTIGPDRRDHFRQLFESFDLLHGVVEAAERIQEQDRLYLTKDQEQPAGPESVDVFRDQQETEGAQLTIGEIHKRSLQKANELLSELSGQPGVSESTMGTAMMYLAEIDRMKGNAQAVRLWAQRLENLNEKNRYNIATLYFRAASMGDEVAFERIGQLLHEEQEAANSKKEQIQRTNERFTYILESPMLRTIIEECAQEGVPADQWINDYAIDDNQKASLKMRYYYQTKRTEGEAAAMGIHYRDEVTNQFLNGDGITNEFAWSEAKSIFAAQDDDEKKAEVFRRFQKLNNDMPLSYFSFTDFVSFSGHVLESPHAIEYNDAKWIERNLEKCRTILIQHGLDTFSAHQESAGLEIALARFMGASPTEVIAKIDEVIARQLQQDIPDEAEGFIDMARNKGFVATVRDAYLDESANLCVEQGDFQTAKIFASEIADQKKKASTLRRLLKKAQTLVDIEAMKPNEMELAFGEDLAEIFKVKTATLEGDIPTLQDLATSYAQRIQWGEDYIIENLLEDSIAATYQLDAEQGHALATDVLEIFEEREVDPFLFRSIASLQLDHDDPEGLQTYYKNAERYEKPINQLRDYAVLAEHIAKAIEGGIQ